MKGFVESHLRERIGDPVPSALLSAIKLFNLRDALKAVVSSKNTAEEVDWELFQMVVQEANNTISTWKGKLHFIILPSISRYLGEEGQIVRNQTKQVTRILRGLDISVIDVGEAFDGQEDPRSLWVYPGGHYDVEGYELVAETILHSLRQIERPD